MPEPVTKSIEELQSLAAHHGGVVEYHPPFMPYIFFPEKNCGFMADPESSSPDDHRFSGFTFFGPDSIKGKFLHLRDALCLSPAEGKRVLTHELAESLTGKIISCIARGQDKENLTFRIAGILTRPGQAHGQGPERVLLIRYHSSDGQPLPLTRPARLYFNNEIRFYPTLNSYLINGKHYELSRHYPIEKVKSIFMTENVHRVLDLEHGQHEPFTVEDQPYEEGFLETGGSFRFGKNSACMLLDQVH